MLMEIMEAQKSSENLCEHFTCSLCSYETIKLRKIQKHFRKQHSITDLLQCPFCKYIVTQEDLFFQHKQAVHPKDRFLCNVCKFSTKKWTRWKRHIMDGHSQKIGREDAVMQKRSTVLRQHNPLDSGNADFKNASTMSKLGTLNDFSHTFDSPLSFQHSNDSKDLLQVGNRIKKQCIFSDKADAKDNVNTRSTIQPTKGHATLKASACNVVNSVCNSNLSTKICIDKGKESYAAEPLLEDNKQVTDSQCTKDLHASSSETRKGGSCKSEEMNPDVLLQLASEHSSSRFENKSSFTQHMSAHENQKSFVCEVCNKVYKTMKSLKHHSLLHTNEGAYTCEFCDKHFKYKSMLTQHMASHTNEKLYVCELCNKSFTSKRNLKRHKNIHTAEKLHTCKYCHKSFSRKGDLDSHIGIHTGEKTHKCSYCSFATRWKNSLEMHERTHRNERFYKCDACEFSSVQPQTLKKHFRIHTGEKPYQCDVCLRYFSRKDHVMNHKRKVHHSLSVS